MIIKTKSRKSGVKQLLSYLFKDETKLENDRHEKLIIRKNVRGRTLPKWVKEFEHNQSLRSTKRKDEVKAYHTVISFHDKDREHIDKAVLKDIAKEYMKQKGVDIMYIATAHYDQEHIHIHIAESGAKYMTGKANRMSKQQFANLKVAMETYQKERYPELVHSVSGRNTKSKLSHLNDRTTQKNTLSKLLEEGYANSKSLDDFVTYLESSGHQPYYRNGVLTGIKYEGDRKFRFSKLGYDKEKMGELSTRDEEQKELSELSNIRENASSRSRESTGREIVDEHEYEEKDLDMEDDDREV